MVGLPDSAVRESQQRIKSAIEHLGFRWPGKGITINLARPSQWQSKVFAARSVQQTRNPPGVTHARLGGEDLHRMAPLCAEGRSLLTRATEVLQLSARTHGRLLRLARTLADLDQSDQVAVHHLAQAVALRREGRHADPASSASLFVG